MFLGLNLSTKHTHTIDNPPTQGHIVMQSFTPADSLSREASTEL
jgi:hypothetical protein